MDYSWVNQWIGKRFQGNGRGPNYDCWGLVRAVLKQQQGIELPDWNEPDFKPIACAREMTKRMNETINEQYASLVHDPKDFDIALLYRKKAALHVGIVINDRVLHINSDPGLSEWVRITDFLKYGGQLRFYRWGGLWQP